MTTLENEKPTPEETYTKADLVSFGNYLLSPERENLISEINKRDVTDADLANWRDSVINN